jgi:hypothetical protein
MTSPWHLIKEALPHVQDPEMKARLEKALKKHNKDKRQPREGTLFVHSKIGFKDDVEGSDDFADDRDHDD